MRLFRNLSIFSSLFILFGGCSKSPDVQERIQGAWNRSPINGCNAEISSDHLTLRNGGALEQHILLRDGRHYDFAGTWAYVPPYSVRLSSWANTFRYTGKEDISQLKVSENLLLDIKNPAVMYLPDVKGCFYTKPK
jgi:hypothetical protein